MSSRPRSHISNGGMCWVASSCSSCTKRVDVVALEGVDVAGEQLAVVVVQRPRVGRAVDGGQRRPGPLQRAVDRRHRGVEQRRPPRRPSTAAPRGGSARPAGAAAGAAARRRRPAGSTPGRRPARPGRRPRAATWRSSTGSTHAVLGPARRPARPRPAATASRTGPSAAPGAAGRTAGRGRRWWRSGTATTAAPSGPRSRRGRARPAPSSPAPRPRRRRTSRACGSSSRSARGGARAAAGRADRRADRDAGHLRPLLRSDVGASTPQDDRQFGRSRSPLLVGDQLRQRAHLGDRLLGREHRERPRRRSSSIPRTARAGAFWCSARQVACLSPCGALPVGVHHHRQLVARGVQPLPARRPSPGGTGGGPAASAAAPSPA